MPREPFGFHSQRRCLRRDLAADLDEVHAEGSLKMWIQKVEIGRVKDLRKPLGKESENGNHMKLTMQHCWGIMGIKGKKRPLSKTYSWGTPKERIQELLALARNDHSAVCVVELVCFLIQESWCHLQVTKSCNTMAKEKANSVWINLGAAVLWHISSSQCCFPHKENMSEPPSTVKNLHPQDGWWESPSSLEDVSFFRSTCRCASSWSYRRSLCNGTAGWWALPAVINQCLRPPESPESLGPSQKSHAWCYWTTEFLCVLVISVHMRSLVIIGRIWSHMVTHGHINKAGHFGRSFNFSCTSHWLEQVPVL